MEGRLSIAYMTRRTFSPGALKHLFFLGIKHSGKSSLAAVSAEFLGWEFLDSDSLVEAVIPQDYTVRTFYAEMGKHQFMELELEAVKKVLEEHHSNPFCLALGGGACDNHSLMDLCRSWGVQVFLDTPEEILFRRIISGGIPPFLSRDDPGGSFSSLFQERRKLYLKNCDVRITAGDQSLSECREFLEEHLHEIIERYYGR